MPKFVQFAEPWTEVNGETLGQVVRIKVEAVIKFQRFKEPRYESDQQALEDFLVVHWAEVIEV